MCSGFCAHRFIYADAGDDNALPCPDWKWNTAEYIFARAKLLGYVTDDDWLESESTLTASQSGQRQTMESLRKSQTVVLEKVKQFGFSEITVDDILHQDGFQMENAIPVREIK
ncbi:hypothetical protein JCM19238_4101 [Vibrio ponticus]|nr:hypothetical protein JCM19238_4101 [Vibrio ponticus]